MATKVILDSSKKIYNLTTNQANKIKEDLTYTNPKYTLAKKHARNPRYISIDKYLFYYKQHKDYLEVPRGYVLEDKHELIDLSLEVTVMYPAFKLELRDTQKKAFDNYIKDTSKGLIVMPTGKGKSILGLYIAYALKQKTLIIVHKDDLVDGWTKDTKLCFGENFDIGLIKAKSRKIGEQITIATIQTLNRMKEEELQELYSEFGLVIGDEFHHSPASTYKLLGNFNACYKIGLTATPEREDGLRDVMNLYVGDICFRAKVSKEDKDILPVNVIIKKSPVSYMPRYTLDTKTHKWILASKDDINRGNSVKISDIPYRNRPRLSFDNVENEVVLNKKYVHLVYEDVTKEYKKGHSCILFFNQKEHVDTYYKYFKERGITKIQKYYGDSKEPKSVMKEMAESKEVLVTLATYSIATEGTNVKSWEVAFLVGSVNNGKNVEQAVGRIRRRKEGKINPARVYDYSQANVYILNKHINTRRTRYKKLQFSIQGDKHSLFKRGFM